LGAQVAMSIVTGQKIGQYHRLEIKPVMLASHPRPDFSSPLA